MRNIGLSLIIVLLSVGAAAQTSDLAIRKAVTKVPIGTGSTGTYSIIATNYGPQSVPAPIIVGDTIPAPAFFTTSTITPPWACTPANFSTHPTSISCRYLAPLAPGQSTTPLSLNVGTTTTPAAIQNCASVDAHLHDTNAANNRDCACMDFKGCRPIAIDLSTGVNNGASLATLATDPHWTIGTVPSGANVSGPIAYIPNITAWAAAAPPARWISPKPPSGNGTPTTTGNYEYLYNFTLGPWHSNQCRLRFQYGADNRVDFFLDGSPFHSSGTNVFATLQPQVTVLIPSPPGNHVLRAVVNNTSSITGLLVRGVVECTCTFFNDPVPNTATTSTE